VCDARLQASGFDLVHTPVMLAKRHQRSPRASSSGA
jgi:hypothetical protein